MRGGLFFVAILSFTCAALAGWTWHFGEIGDLTRYLVLSFTLLGIALSVSLIVIVQLLEDLKKGQKELVRLVLTVPDMSPGGRSALCQNKVYGVPLPSDE